MSDAQTPSIREAVEADGPQWARMRGILYDNDAHRDNHEAEVAAHFAGSQEACAVVFVVDRGGGALGGFVEVGLRSYAEGCTSSPVPYIEGWYVEDDLRRTGIGRKLIEAAERWAIGGGYTEIGSDTSIDNLASQAAHARLGFVEVDRAVCFRKELPVEPALRAPRVDE